MSEERETVKVEVELWRDGAFMGTVELETNIIGATGQEILDGLVESFGDEGGFEIRLPPMKTGGYS